MGELNELNRQANMKTVYLNASYFPAVELLSALGTAVILLYGGYQALDLGTEAARQAQIGILVAFVGYLTTFFDPIQQLSNLYTTYQQGMAALDKIFDLLDTAPDMVDKPDAADPGTLRGEIEMDHVWFSYGLDQAAGLKRSSGKIEDARARDSATRDVQGEPEADDWALEDVSIHVAPGETLALVGETGAGKSTFAKLVSRFYDPQRGRVLVDGTDLRDLRSSCLRSQLGIVPQEGFLFSGSVRENIAFGRPDASGAEVEAAADVIGAGDFIRRLPGGFDAEVGERGVALSAGQRQLIAFARALLAEPRILILDEATSNVDVRTERAIEAGLERLLRGRTAIVIAHRLSTIRGADRIAVLEHGRIVESGTHDKLIEAGGRYAELYGTWADLAAA
jgi:ATP-binding cassette, subfamily B, bacterial